MKLIRLLGVAVLCAGLLTACSSSLVDPNPNEDNGEEDTGNNDTEAMMVDLDNLSILV